MSTFAILGLVWMIAVVLGIWAIAGLLFIAQLDRRKDPFVSKHWPAKDVEFCDVTNAHLGAKENV